MITPVLPQLDQTSYPACASKPNCRHQPIYGAPQLPLIVVITPKLRATLAVVALAFLFIVVFLLDNGHEPTAIHAALQIHVVMQANADSLIGVDGIF